MDWRRKIMQKRKSLGKVLAAVATLLTMFAIAPLTARAETQTGSVNYINSGEVTWSYDTETKVVTVTGTGTRAIRMSDWDRHYFKNHLAKSPLPLSAEKVQFIDCNIEGDMGFFF